jgi:RND superfamily putative drug exporter
MTVLAQVVGTRFEDKFTAGNTPSQQATNILLARFPAKAGDTADVVFHTSTPITDGANRAAIAQVIRTLTPLAHVQSVTSPFASAGAHQISADGTIAYAVVQFNEVTADLPTKAVQAVITTAQAAGHPGFQVALGGNPMRP